MGDEDDEDSAPTKYEFSVESKLDEDHLFYLQFTNNFISNVSRARDFDHCQRWLEKLAGEPMYGVEAKRNRNMYLAKLLIAMSDNKIIGPFATFPPAGALPHAGDAFGLTTEEERERVGSMLFEEHDRELNMADYKYKSEDGRTYIATCSLPNSSGVMGYVGITYGGGEGLWLNKLGEKVSLTDVMCGDRVTSIDTETPVKEHIRLYETYDWRNPSDPPEDPFNFIPELPSTQSNTALIAGSHAMSGSTKKFLKEMYVDELVVMLEKLMANSKEHIDEIMRHRYNKIIPQIYKSYQEEVERGLNDYKDARKEWQLVMAVIQDIKKNERDLASASPAAEGGAPNQTNKLLQDTYNEACVRKKDALLKGQALDNTKGDLHKNIHERLVTHKHELGIMNGHIDNLGCELKKLRVDARRKQLVLEGLMLDRKRKQTHRED